MYDKDIFDELSRDLKSKEYIGESGAGLVRVYIRADLFVTKVEIDYKAVKSSNVENDLSLMADLFQAAMNKAILNANEDLLTLTQNVMGKKL